ncbi:hypothetical protein DFH09DRAFT_1103644 [Mycena vulgaris]|nr:hypothetical protein DFH09DRAFT_1103644 [Mycena vulgaris]
MPVPGCHDNTEGRSAPAFLRIFLAHTLNSPSANLMLTSLHEYPEVVNIECHTWRGTLSTVRIRVNHTRTVELARGGATAIYNTAAEPLFLGGHAKNAPPASGRQLVNEPNVKRPRVLDVDVSESQVPPSNPGPVLGEDEQELTPVTRDCVLNLEEQYQMRRDVGRDAAQVVEDVKRYEGQNRSRDRTWEGTERWQNTVSYVFAEEAAYAKLTSLVKKAGSDPDFNAASHFKALAKLFPNEAKWHVVPDSAGSLAFSREFRLCRLLNFVVVNLGNDLNALTN